MATVTSPSGHRLRSGLSAAGPPSGRCRSHRRRRRSRRSHPDRCSCHQDLLPGRCRRCASGRRSGSIERPVQVRPVDSHRRARCRPKGTSLALVLVWPRTRLELRLRRAVARGEGGEFGSCRWQCPSMIRLGVYRGSWSMGFVIQMAAGKAEAEPHTGRTRPGRQRSRRAAGREDRDQDPRDTAQWLALGVVTRWSPFGQPARSPVGAVSTDSEALATTGSATGADSADPLGRTTMTGQRACSTHWRLTEPSNMLAKPPRPR
jgi:hypothetical protein